MHQVKEREASPAADSADALRDAVLGIARAGGGTAARLRRADTSVALRLGPTEVVTLLLDRTPVEVSDEAVAEITVDVPEALAADVAGGHVSLTSLIVAGDVVATGPVRKFLEVEPILRGVLRESAPQPSGPRTVASPLPAGHVVDPELLAIETRGLRKSFSGNPVLRGLDIAIPEGLVSVVLGPSGTGKSVLLQHVIGVMRPDAGDVLIRGRLLSRMSRKEILALRRGIGVMFQDGALFSAMNLFDNVAFPLRQHTDLPEDEVRDVVMQHLSSVGLANAADRMPNEISGGMRKRAGLARALVLDPGILLCDEPDSGLDPVRTSLLGDLLLAQHAEYGGTMVVVTHNVMLARLLAEHITVVWRGQVLESGLAEHVLASETPFVQQFLNGEAEGPLGMDA